MITNEQITQLDNLLGKCLRLAISIEFTVNCIYLMKAPMKQPMFYTDETGNWYENKKFSKEFKELEKANFISSLKQLEKLDTKKEIFSIKQYDTLHQIRKDRNAIMHEMLCPYISLDYKKEKMEKEYDNDIKRLKHFISTAEQYDILTKKIIKKMGKDIDINVWDTIKITAIKYYKF